LALPIFSHTFHWTKLQVVMLQEILSCKRVRQYVIIMELFDGAILNYPKYGKEIYTLVQIVKLKTFFVGKRDHLSYWLSLIIVISIKKERFSKKGTINGWEFYYNLFSVLNTRREEITSWHTYCKCHEHQKLHLWALFFTCRLLDTFTYESYKEEYIEDEEFREIF